MWLGGMPTWRIHPVVCSTCYRAPLWNCQLHGILLAQQYLLMAEEAAVSTSQGCISCSWDRTGMGRHKALLRG